MGVSTDSGICGDRDAPVTRTTDGHVASKKDENLVQNVLQQSLTDPGAVIEASLSDRVFVRAAVRLHWLAIKPYAPAILFGLGLPSMQFLFSTAEAALQDGFNLIMLVVQNQRKKHNQKNGLTERRFFQERVQLSSEASPFYRLADTSF